MAKDLPVAHALGRRIDGVTHMCPGDGCGWPVRAFCPVCLGVGEVTEERLARWQREALAGAGAPVRAAHAGGMVAL